MERYPEEQTGNCQLQEEGLKEETLGRKPILSSRENTSCDVPVKSDSHLREGLVQRGFQG